MKLHCRIYSSEKLEELYRPPIIFLHGMALNGNIFKKVAPVISKNTRRKVYVPDVRNHGKSPWVNEMNYDVLSNDVLELMQQNNIPKAILIGSSMGGRIAMVFALKYPYKVEALIVEDMTPRNVPSSGSNVVQVLHQFVVDILKEMSPETDLSKAKRDLFEFVVNISPLLADKEKVMAMYDPDYIPIIKEGNMFKLECNEAVLKGMLENDALVQNLPDLEITYTGDVLFLYGSKGFFNLENDSSINKLFPRAIIKRVEGSSHLIHVDSPEEYSNIVTDFILQGSLPHSKY